MDEILASIRRIIESSDEKPGAFVASSAARASVAGRAVGREGVPERSSPIDPPTPAARVVPFSERAPFATPPQDAFHEADERWMPLTEPANQPDRPAAHDAPVVAGEAPSEAEPVEAIAPSDRWTQEFDDVESWTVLDSNAEPVANSAQAETDGEATASFEASARSTIEPTIEAEGSEALAGRAVEDGASGASEPEPLSSLAEPQPEMRAKADARIEVEAAPASLGSVETFAPADASDAAANTDDDFPVDFDEADFVEALDRNTAFLSVPVEPPVVSAVGAEARSDAGLAERAQERPFLRQRSAAEERSAIFSPTAKAEPAPSAPAPAPSVMQETSALMSDQAGAEVAAAFDDLARAIRDGQMKSMEEMAREMLRPMLQDWLDDNLPRLVERLVRDEIERVSRGVRG